MEVDFLSHFEKRLEEYCTPGLGPHFYFFQSDTEKSSSDSETENSPRRPTQQNENLAVEKVKKRLISEDREKILGIPDSSDSELDSAGSFTLDTLRVPINGNFFENNLDWSHVPPPVMVKRSLSTSEAANPPSKKTKDNQSRRSASNIDSPPKKRLNREEFIRIIKPLIGKNLEDNIRWINPGKSFFIENTVLGPEFYAKFGYEKSSAGQSFYSFMKRNFHIVKEPGKHQMICDLTKKSDSRPTSPASADIPQIRKQECNSSFSEVEDKKNKFRQRLLNHVQDDDSENIHWICKGETFMIQRLSKISLDFLNIFEFDGPPRENFRIMLKQCFGTDRNGRGEYICDVVEAEDSDSDIEISPPVLKNEDVKQRSQAKSEVRSLTVKDEFKLKLFRALAPSSSTTGCRWLSNGNLYIGSTSEFPDHYLREKFGFQAGNPRDSLRKALAPHFERIKVGNGRLFSAFEWKPKDPDFYEGSPVYAEGLTVKEEPSCSVLALPESNLNHYNKNVQKALTSEQTKDSDAVLKVLFMLIDDKECIDQTIRWRDDGKSFVIPHPRDLTAEFLDENFGLTQWTEFYQILNENFEVSGNYPHAITCISKDENFQVGKDYCRGQVVETGFDREMRKKYQSRKYNKAALIDVILDKYQEVRERDEKIAHLENEKTEQNMLQSVAIKSLEEEKDKKVRDLEAKNQKLRQVLEEKSKFGTQNLVAKAESRSRSPSQFEVSSSQNQSIKFNLEDAIKEMKIVRMSADGRAYLEKHFGSDLTVFEFGQRGEGWPDLLNDWLLNGHGDFKGQNFVPYGILRQFRELQRLGREKMKPQETDP